MILKRFYRGMIGEGRKPDRREWWKEQVGKKKKEGLRH